MDQIGPILLGIAALITAASAVATRLKGQAKIAEADAFRLKLLVRRIASAVVPDPGKPLDPKLIADIEKEATQ